MDFPPVRQHKYFLTHAVRPEPAVPIAGNPGLFLRHGAGPAQLASCLWHIQAQVGKYLAITKDQLDWVMKSELNFPLRSRVPLDFGEESNGKRWAITLHLDGILLAKSTFKWPAPVAAQLADYCRPTKGRQTKGRQLRIFDDVWRHLNMLAFVY
ncbi:unnamed protein product [Effrenium voratum]|uniref:Uncharacterized protein n=1 Tax=Effrenium voratum TaxID=2562239 RepID=A0AA36MSQ0_9DINO|nr:unnamed protein product [Effrenium voratum]